MYKNAQKLERKTRPKFPATTPGCSMVKIAGLNDAFLEVFQPQASPVEGQSLQQEKEKKERRKKIPKIKRPKAVKILISVHAQVKMS